MIIYCLLSINIIVKTKTHENNIDKEGRLC